jgi:hypothetical protein
MKLTPLHPSPSPFMNCPKDIEVFRKMAPADKLRLIGAIHMQAREWKRAAFKAQHPDWPPEKIVRKVKEVFLYGTG